MNKKQKDSGRNTLNYIYAMLVCILVILLILNLSLDFSDLNNIKEDKASNKAKYHIQVIMQSNNSYFEKTFKSGAGKAGKVFDSYIEYVDASNSEQEALEELVKYAIHSDVDAIALQSDGIYNLEELLDEAKLNGIKVLIYNNDIFNLNDHVSVGANSYDIGYTIGRAIINLGDYDKNVSVILNDSYAIEENQYKNIKIQGIVDAVKKYENISIESIYTVDSKKFEIERVTKEIMTEYPDTNVIICTDTNSTPGIAQVIVNENKVGDVAIIGYGNISQTIDYIKKGVIDVSICPDAYSLGYEVVDRAYDIICDEDVSILNDIDLFIINKDNANRFEDTSE